MVFHNPHKGACGGHIGCTQATFEWAVPRQSFVHAFPCSRGVSPGPAIEMTWNVNILYGIIFDIKVFYDVGWTQHV